MEFAYIIFILAFALLANITKIENALAQYDLLKKTTSVNINGDDLPAHNLVMQMGEILARTPTKRYPDMENCQASVKQYYARVGTMPTSIIEKVPAKLRQDKVTLHSVK